jgi:hypothetical protein
MHGNSPLRFFATPTASSEEKSGATSVVSKTIDGLTYAATVEGDKAKSRAGWNRWNVIVSVAVINIVVCTFIYFSLLGVAGQWGNKP